MESANNAGHQVLQTALTDVNKLQNYSSSVHGSRWVVAICYSAAAKQALQNYAASNSHNTSYHQDASNTVGCMVITL